MLKIAFDPIYKHPLPEGHRFPMLKYELIPEQLLYEGTAKADNFFSPLGNLTFDELEILMRPHILGVHKSAYYEQLKNLTIDPKMERRIGFPLSKVLFEREVIIAAGTIQCADFALQYGVAMNIAGGTHHAYSDKGEGFCLLNDVAIASHYLLNSKKASQILVIDLDVHQGNGTAEIFADNPQVFTFSMHGAENYPLKKEKSDLDIALPTYTSDIAYLSALKTTLPALMEQVKPDFLFYVSGVDILESDKLGKLSVSMLGCKERDFFVFETAKKWRIPIVVSMGGGYSPKIIDIVDAHCNTFRLAEELYF